MVTSQMLIYSEIPALYVPQAREQAEIQEAIVEKCRKILEYQKKCERRDGRGNISRSGTIKK